MRLSKLQDVHAAWWHGTGRRRQVREGGHRGAEVIPQETRVERETDGDCGRALRRSTPAVSSCVPGASGERTQSPNSVTFWRGAIHYPGTGRHAGRTL